MWLFSSFAVRIKFTVLDTLMEFLIYDFELYFIVNYIVLLEKYYIIFIKIFMKMISLVISILLSAHICVTFWLL